MNERSVQKMNRPLGGAEFTPALSGCPPANNRIARYTNLTVYHRSRRKTPRFADE
jgi:hypothetical protein